MHVRTEEGAIGTVDSPLRRQEENGTTPTKYYDAGVTKVTNVNGTLSYLVSDGLGSVSAALDANGNLTSAQLFAPYGASRYSSGTMPTSYGFTGQRGDPSGLTYMHARYYDGSVGTFTSADVVQGPNRYGYVMGNPTTMTDPTGQMAACGGQGMDDGMCLHGHHTHQRDQYDDESCPTDFAKRWLLSPTIRTYVDVAIVLLYHLHSMELQLHLQIHRKRLKMPYKRMRIGLIGWSVLLKGL